MKSSDSEIRIITNDLIIKWKKITKKEDNDKIIPDENIKNLKEKNSEKNGELNV